MHSVCNTRLTTSTGVMLHNLMKINYYVLKVTYQVKLLLIKGCHLILVSLYILRFICKGLSIDQYKTSQEAHCQQSRDILNYVFIISPAARDPEVINVIL